jgi:hypothetical protein
MKNSLRIGMTGQASAVTWRKRAGKGGEFPHRHGMLPSRPQKTAGRPPTFHVSPYTILIKGNLRA